MLVASGWPQAAISRMRGVMRTYSKARVANFYALFPTTFPHGAPPTSRFNFDEKALQQEYFRLQKEAHPDVQRKSGSLIDSALLSTAYKALLDPHARAEHILEINSLGAETDSKEQNLLAVDVLEEFELVDDLQSQDELADVLHRFNETHKSVLHELAQASDNGDLLAMQKLLSKAKFYWRLIAAAEAKGAELDSVVPSEVEKT